MRETLSFALVGLLGTLIFPATALATPEFAKQWDSSCASCHVGAPTGLDEEGVAFRLAGYDQAIEADNPRPKLFLSLVTDVATLSGDGYNDKLDAPESATLFTLLRLDRAGKVKVFAIGELADTDQDGLQLDFAHGHVQINPLEERERLNLRVGNIEPMTRLWNSDMRREFESALWGGVDTATGAVEATGGGHAHGHGSAGGRPGILPASEWGGDVSSVIGRSLLVSGGFTDEAAFAGVFWKRGGRGFDNSTVARGFEYSDLDEAEKDRFNRQQTQMAKKWERSVILGLSAYAGSSSRDVFDGTSLGFSVHGGEEHAEEEHGGDEHGEEDHGTEGDEHGDEPGDEHGDAPADEHGDEHGGAEEGDHVDEFLPTRNRGTSRLVGEVKTRWDRYGFYLVGVYGENDYRVGDPEHWEEHGEFEAAASGSTDFFAWALEGSGRFAVTRTLTGRVGLRYETLEPEASGARNFERVVTNVTIPIRMIRPALWPYAEAVRDLVLDDWQYRVGLRLGY